MDITFACEKCGQHIAVDEAGTGQQLACPKCGELIIVPSKPSEVTEPSGVQFTTCPRCGKDVFATDTRCVHCKKRLSEPTSLSEIWKPIYDNQPVREIGLTLRSGTQLLVAEITLYPKDLVRKAQGLTAEAKKKFGGFSTGLGFWGSAEWVIGGSLLLGAAESLVSGSMANEGVELLKRLEQLLQEIRKSAKPIPVSQIANVELLTPSYWIASYRRDVEYEETIMLPDGFLGIKTKFKIEKHQKVEEQHYIHNGDPYVVVKTDQGKTVTVVWENVEQYYTI